jgi:hypothetical protein
MATRLDAKVGLLLSAIWWCRYHLPLGGGRNSYLKPSNRKEWDTSVTLGRAAGSLPGDLNDHFRSL